MTTCPLSVLAAAPESAPETSPPLAVATARGRSRHGRSLMCVSTAVSALVSTTRSSGHWATPASTSQHELGALGRIRMCEVLIRSPRGCHVRA
jgi:hypothetical protein